MKILDATCGARSIWFQKNYPFATFLDIRKEKINTLQNGNALISKRSWNINPNIVADWTKPLPFNEGEFDIVVFDPPHIIKNVDCKVGVFHRKYGFLNPFTYKQDIKNGFFNLFHVLKNDGVFILKWNETYIKLSDILKLSPYPALFGSRTGHKSSTYWVLFIKKSLNKELR
jgi:hypothetical protein